MRMVDRLRPRCGRALRCETKLSAGQRPAPSRRSRPQGRRRRRSCAARAAGSTASGSAPRRAGGAASATASAIMTSDPDRAPSTAVKIQNSQASSRACGPCGSSADCQPRQPASGEAADRGRSAARALIAASLRRLPGEAVAAGHGGQSACGSRPDAASCRRCGRAPRPSARCRSSSAHRRRAARSDRPGSCRGTTACRSAGPRGSSWTMFSIEPP